MRLSLREALDAVGEAVLLDQLCAAGTVLGFGGELGIAALVEVQGDDFGQSVPAYIQGLALLQAFEKIKLLLAELEQLAVELPVERGIRQEQERRAGVHDGIRVLAQVVRGLADEGHAAQVLADGLDGGESRFEKLLVLHGRKQLLDDDVLGYAQVLRVIENGIDPAQQPHHQRLDEVGVLRGVHALEVEALNAAQLQLIIHVVEDRGIDAGAGPLRQVAVQVLGQQQIARGGGSRRRAGTCRARHQRSHPRLRA